MGRPSKYTKEIGRRVCETIADSKVGLKGLALQYDWFPSTSTIFRWLDRHQAFRQRYARARRAQAQMLAMEQIEIVDKASCRTPQHVQKARIRAEARRWAASRLAPQDFGDRLEVRGDAENPVAIVGSWKDLSDLATEKASQ